MGYTLVDSITYRLSIAIRPLDRGSGRAIESPLQVTLDGVSAAMNDSGYYVFCDLKKGRYVIRIRSDGGLYAYSAIMVDYAGVPVVKDVPLSLM